MLCVMVRRLRVAVAGLCLLAAAGCASNDPLENGELPRVGRVHVRLEPADRAEFAVDSNDAVGDFMSLGFAGYVPLPVGYVLLPFVYPFAGAIDARQARALRDALGPGFDVGPIARDRLAAALADAGCKVVPGEAGADSGLTLEVREAVLRRSLRRAARGARADPGAPAHTHALSRQADACILIV